MESKVKQIPNAILIGEVKRALAAGHTATFRVKGYSMRLFLENERDAVRLEAVDPNAIRVGDVVLAEFTPGQYALHRVIKREDSRLTLRGDGNTVGTEQCLTTDVVGIATAFYRKGRTTPDLVTGWKWRIYSSIWLALTPLRRIILGVYRRLPFRI